MYTFAIKIYRWYIHQLYPWLNFSLEVFVFEKKGKWEYPEKDLWEQERETQQTQPKYQISSANRSRWHWSDAAGGRMLSPPRHVTSVGEVAQRNQGLLILWTDSSVSENFIQHEK